MMKLLYTTRKTDFLSGTSHGWGNGYVAVPKEHPFYGKKYDEYVKVKSIDNIKNNEAYIPIFLNLMEKDKIENKLIRLDVLIDVHGGITLSKPYTECNWLSWDEKPEDDPNNWWVFGFDTTHVDDNLDNWPKSRVEGETLRFKYNLIKALDLLDE